MTVRQLFWRVAMLTCFDAVPLVLVYVDLCVCVCAPARFLATSLVRRLGRGRFRLLVYLYVPCC